MDDFSLEGVIQDQAGLPVPNAVVMISESPSQHSDIAQITGESGRFSFGSGEAGHYVFTISLPNGDLVHYRCTLPKSEKAVIVMPKNR